MQELVESTRMRHKYSNEFIDLILQDEFKISLAQLQSKRQTGDVSRIRRALIVILRDDFQYKFEAIVQTVNRKHPNCVIQYHKHHELVVNPSRDPEYNKIYKKLSIRYKLLKDPQLKKYRIRELDLVIQTAMFERDQLRIELEDY
mgnify:CR=1 FL=1